MDLKGHYLEKLGICSQIAVLRLVFNGVPSMNDPKLYIKNLYFEHVPVRVYWPKLSTPVGNLRGIIYLHGGIGVVGSIKAYERVCRYLAKESESVVVCIGYRLSPEHPPPVQSQDSLTAALYFLKNARFYAVNPNRIIVAGDSSGATMAAALCQELAVRRDVPRIQAQILLYPFLQAVDFTLPSYQQNHSIPILFKKRAVKLAFQYFTQAFKLDLMGVLNSAHVSEDMKAKCKKWISADLIPDEFKVRGYVPTKPAPYSEQLGELCKPALETWFSPLLAEDEVIRQLPETFLLTCEYDILRDDGLLYKKRLEDNGVPVTWHHVKDGFHGIAYLVSLGPLQFPSTKIAMNSVIRFICGLPK
uniref:Uncharacterized protein n=1 Tax=Sphaerodactylus townsendi TaxID=933632 RepID=A0ACB8EDZ3_9SAUR